MNADVHGLSGAYAVDALDAREREAFERHLVECQECRDEVAGLREAAISLAALTSTMPPASLRSSVLESIRVVRPLAPLVRTDDATLPAASTPAPTTPAPTEPTAPATTQPTEAPDDDGVVVPFRPRRRAATWLAGAAAAAVLAIATLTWSPWDNGGQVSASDQILQAKDATRYSQVIDGTRATVVRSASLHKAVLLADNLPAAPAGKDFQAWFNLPGRGYVSAGVMPHATSGPMTVVLQGDASSATAVGITIEPAGGSTSPTSAPIASFSFA